MSGLLFFSFLVDRSATLILGVLIEGIFMLSYVGGQFFEVFEKRLGVLKQVVVYPGSVCLVLELKGKMVVQWNVRFLEGGKILIMGEVDD